MPWSSLATNQCVNLNNLRDAIANGVFVAISAVPSGTKEITKTEALAYVDIQTSPLSSKASNQLVVKNNLSAKIYTYNRYDLNLTNCTTSNPIPVWSNLNIPYGSYTINGLYVYQIIPTTHSTFTYEITGYTPYTCTPVTRYTYQTSNVNPTTCALSNTMQWWSYNNYANGYYYINGPGTLYSLSSASHSNFSNQITSVTPGTCSAAPKYSYDMYFINLGNCALTYNSQVYSVDSYYTGYYNLFDASGQTYYVYLVTSSHTNYTHLVNFIGTASACVANPCKTWYFHNSGDPGSAQEVFSYTLCNGSFTNIYVNAGATTTGCVAYNSTPPDGNLGDHPYTFNEICT